MVTNRGEEAPHSPTILTYPLTKFHDNLRALLVSERCGFRELRSGGMMSLPLIADDAAEMVVLSLGENARTVRGFCRLPGSIFNACSPGRACFNPFRLSVFE